MTDSIFTNSNILKIDTDKIHKYLSENYIVIVAGFQGIDNNKNITTLGRGGSDTTATELAYYLKADACQIFKDTKSIYTANPKIIPTAKKLNSISYDDMMELAKMGAEVIAYKSVKYAKEHNLCLIVKSVDDDLIGTVINKNGSEKIAYRIISCTKKKLDENLDIITFILKGNMKKNKAIAEAVIKASKIKNYIIEDSNNRISIILPNNYSNNILKQIHDKFMEKY